MLRVCVIEYGGSCDTHLPLVEFACSNTYHSSIDMTPYEMLDNMLLACVIEYGESCDTHLTLVVFANNNTYHSSIDMAPYKMLYGRKCRTPTCWLDLGEKQFASL